MADASEEAQADIKAEIERLEGWGEELDNRMERLGSDMKDGWKEFKADTRKTLDEINQGLAEVIE